MPVDVSQYGDQFARDLNVQDISFYNNVDSDADGARDTSLLFHGETAAAETHALGKIAFVHDGGSADHKGRMILSLNTGAEDLTPSAFLTLDNTSGFTFNGANPIIDGKDTNGTFTLANNNSGATAVIVYGDTHATQSDEIDLKADTINVVGNLDVSGTPTFTSESVHNGGIDVNGNGDVSGTLGVTGVATFTAQSVHNGGIDVNGNGDVSGTLGVTGAATFTAQSVHNGGIDVNGNGDISGTLGVTGVATFTAQSVHTGGLTSAGNLLMTHSNPLVEGQDTDGVLTLRNKAAGDAFYPEIKMHGNTEATPGLVWIRASSNGSINGSSITMFGADSGGSYQSRAEVRCKYFAVTDTDNAPDDYFKLTVTDNDSGVLAIGSSATIMDTTITGDLIVNQDDTTTNILKVDGTANTVTVSADMEVSDSIFFDRSNTTDPDGTIYFGSDTTDGSIRIDVDDNGIKFQRRETGSWVTKNSWSL